MREGGWSQPGDLTQFIKLANLVWDESSLPSLDVLSPVLHGKLLQRLSERFQQEFQPKPEGDAHGRPASQAARLPLREQTIKRKNVQGERIRDTTVRDWSGDRPEVLYGICYAVRYALEAIVSARETRFSGWFPLPPSPYRVPKLLLDMSFAGHEGEVSQQRDPYLQNFLPELEKHDMTRLRRCGVCSRFFWATRLGKKFCSAGCGSTARIRRKRENERKYEENRKRYRKQGFKAKESLQLRASLRRAEKEASKRERG